MRPEKFMKKHDEFHENYLAEMQHGRSTMNRIFFDNFVLLFTQLEDIFCYLSPIFEADMFFISIKATFRRQKVFRKLVRILNRRFNFIKENEHELTKRSEPYIELEVSLTAVAFILSPASVASTRDL